ncbi:hypothetical protein CTA1_3041 [Colletotrichum tanaceti]|uniref:Uncharacterized protein n=1 Tax=Colletotrichum tanaceti TaxID=1306861 RepID=A0A4V6DK18_9PEZI|nr:hypothetical protein CTA1_3041 [Colletotrichum tanaceti]
MLRASSEDLMVKLDLASEWDDWSIEIDDSTTSTLSQTLFRVSGFDTILGKTAPAPEEDKVLIMAASSAMPSMMAWLSRRDSMVVSFSSTKEVRISTLVSENPCANVPRVVSIPWREWLLSSDASLLPKSVN